MTFAFSMFLSVEECALEFMCMFVLASFCQFTFHPVLGLLWVGAGGVERRLCEIPLHHGASWGG